MQQVQPGAVEVVDAGEVEHEPAVAGRVAARRAAERAGAARSTSPSSRATGISATRRNTRRRLAGRVDGRRSRGTGGSSARGRLAAVSRRRSSTRVPVVPAGDVDPVHEHAHEPQAVTAFGARGGRRQGPWSRCAARPRARRLRAHLDRCPAGAGVLDRVRAGLSRGDQHVARLARRRARVRQPRAQVAAQRGELAGARRDHGREGLADRLRDAQRQQRDVVVAQRLVADERAREVLERGR